MGRLWNSGLTLMKVSNRQHHMKYQPKLKPGDMVSFGVYQSITYDRIPSGIENTILHKEQSWAQSRHATKNLADFAFVKESIWVQYFIVYMLKTSNVGISSLWSNCERSKTELRKCSTLRNTQSDVNQYTHQGISLPILVRPLLLTAYPIRGSVIASQARPRKRMMDAEKAPIYNTYGQKKIYLKNSLCPIFVTERLL